MEWSNEIQNYLQQVKSVSINTEAIERIVNLLDLTRLDEPDTESNVARFIEKAHTSYGNVAGVCVYPAYLRMVAAEFSGSPIRAITVANFPRGDQSIEDVLIQINTALQDGAQEIDVVFPYQSYLQGDTQAALDFVMSCRAACGERLILKVIIEVAAFNDLKVLSDAAQKIWEAGADFVKTSTGKGLPGATLDTAACLLLTLKNLPQQADRHRGVKVSGGIRDLEKAAQFILLADLIMGKRWTNPHTFRIGASHLIEAIDKAKVT